ncbi:PepSY-associated TM helix domain-containing protein [Novosphingobium taihuense]|nr:PepSY-associated TM helix domain-containing protein [Novosphingobium taihuense]TWH88688.1 putative iron-regulated membrane protein [Novosphingobium taihuense]
MQRSGFLAWHRRLALLFAPLLLLQALTGAALLFREPLAGWLGPNASELPVRPVSDLARAAGSTGARLDRLFLPLGPGYPATAQMTGPDGHDVYAAIDPGSATLLRQGTILAFPLEAALQWHYRLMAGTAGLTVVALNAIALLLICGTGLRFWWPSKGRIVKALAINPRMPPRVRLRHWHRSGGVATAIVVLFSAMTGLLLVVPDLLPAGKSAQSAPVVTTGAQIDAAIDVAQRAFPHARIRDVRFPKADRLDINFLAPEDGPRSVHVVSVRLSQPELLKALPAEGNPVLWMKVLPLHAGDSFGLVGRLLLLAEALILAALAITGPLMWWQKRIRSK